MFLSLPTLNLKPINLLYFLCNSIFQFPYHEESSWFGSYSPVGLPTLAPTVILYNLTMSYLCFFPNLFMPVVLVIVLS